MNARRALLGPWTGFGLVVANMIGAGVFLSAGFMVQDLDALEILLCWGVGLCLALCGTVAYGAVAVWSGASGGEYRYLHDTLHPWLGSAAGWASLVVGFAAPVAIDAEAAGAFLQTLWPAVDPTWFGTAAILGLTAAHGLQLSWSRNVQNGLVAVKVVAVLAFVGVGLWLGSWAWPTWTPPGDTEGFPARAFASNLYWVAFAFSGWNAAIYAAAEFRDPRRDVPRAMWTGCLAVGLFYLVANWVFVANLSPERATLVTEAERLTLAHLVMQDLWGPGAATVTSVVAAWVLLSAQSAMTLVGPRVVAEMARDGMLPPVFATAPGRPPIAGLVAQAAFALILLHGQTLLQTVTTAGAVLIVFSALVAASTFVLPQRPSWPVLVAAAVYVVAAAVLLVAGFATQSGLLPTVLGIAVLSTLGWVFSERTRLTGSR